MGHRYGLRTDSRTIATLIRHAAWVLAAAALAACATYEPYAPNTSDEYYVVQPGDNLYSIAFALETTAQKLREANRWVDPARLQPGMRLAIPGRSQGASRASVDPLDRGLPQSAGDGNLPRPAGYIWPLREFEVSSRFGNRYGRPHSGIDLRAPRGTPVHASAAGRVRFSGVRNGYGYMVVIDHGQGVETWYAHNERNLVSVGQRVAQGEVIARVGRSGRATGYHLHFEYRRNGQALDPALRMQAAL